MILPLVGLPYKVSPFGRTAYGTWRGWRLWWWGLYIRDACGCPGSDHVDVPCECKDREPHTHTGFGTGDIPLHLRWPR